jgi:hypothetical protein
LGNKAFELALDLEVNMRWAHPIRTRGVGAGFYRFNPIDAIVIRSNFDATDEIWIQRRGVGVVGMRVSAVGIGLPDCERHSANRLAIEIEHSPSDLDDLTLRKPFDPFD